MKKISKILAAIAIGITCLSTFKTAEAIIYSKPTTLLDFSQEYNLPYTRECFNLGSAYAEGITAHSDGYSDYLYKPNTNDNTALKIRIDMYEYDAYYFVPYSAVYCYDATTNTCVESKSLRCYLQSNYLTFENLNPNHNYYIKLHIYNASMGGFLYISSDGTYSMKYSY